MSQENGFAKRVEVLIEVIRQMKQTLEYIKAFAMRCFSGYRGSHAWDHTLRVYGLCMHIGQAESADMEVMKVCALLHDVGRSFQDASRGSICHAEKGAEMAKALLENYPLSAERKSNIIHCVRSHRFRGNCEPGTLESKVLYDADKLDSIGAIGVARAFQFAGEVGARLHNPSVHPECTRAYSEEDTGYREFRLKLFSIKDRMYTEEGRRMAKERHEFMVMFFKRFLEEYDGRR
jgi:uncharacterized protein